MPFEEGLDLTSVNKEHSCPETLKGLHSPQTQEALSLIMHVQDWYRMEDEICYRYVKMRASRFSRR